MPRFFQCMNIIIDKMINKFNTLKRFGIKFRAAIVRILKVVMTQVLSTKHNDISSCLEGS